ncbi:ABC transporter ATP-binding protein [Mesorhizobium sp. KR9-304]|uniref:ABC transporter ATP-binding protein n=1 Tax=Mesorhizobium sp. KR9-304 TaxID=3156614 RepID=UPI0032B615CE
MVFIRAHNIGLRYPVPRHVRLRTQGVTRVGGLFSAPGQGARHVTALDGISFKLKPGDRLGLVGTNGAGKTTLLKVLYGIYEPTSGSIEKKGRVDALFNIGLGFRNLASGRRNIVVRGLINGWSPAEIEDRMEDIIAFSELGDFIDMPLNTYSQGMSARLAFAIATSFHPEILLMDEWIGAGDKDFQEKAKARLDAMIDKAGIIVLASHNDALIKKVCNRVMTLEHGRIRSLEAI